MQYSSLTRDWTFYSNSYMTWVNLNSANSLFSGWEAKNDPYKSNQTQGLEEWRQIKHGKFWPIKDVNLP